MGYRLVTSPMISVGGAFHGIKDYAAKAMAAKNDFFVHEDGVSAWALFQTMGIEKWYEFGQQYDPEMCAASETKPLD